MMVEPKPEFLALTEAEVMAAIEDPNDPIYQEVVRLVFAYSDNFAAFVERLGFWPEGLPEGTPLTPIEAVANRMSRQSFEGARAELLHEQGQTLPAAPPTQPFR